MGIMEKKMETTIMGYMEFSVGKALRMTPNIGC